MSDKKHHIVRLTRNQIWFIKCALELQNHVLPLSPDSLDDKTFKADYGISKKQILKELENLTDKMKQF